MITDQLQTVSDSLSSPWAIPVLTLVADVVMRVFKTKDPKSVFYVIAKALNILAGIFTKIAVMLDGVVQRTKDDEKK